MKEITRIHIAKVAYDIEIDAKKDLEHYIAELAKHTDEEVMQDIEARIVELLAENKVVAGGVITKTDVSKVRDQLGEPADFADGDKASVPPVADEAPEVDKRLYRDVDNALLGGVLSGVAAYIQLDPTVVRLLFVILVLISHGSAIIVYALMWFIVPPARTAGQKLQMQGKPITAASIREFSEREFTNERVAAIRTGAIIIAGLGMLACALMATVATLIVMLHSLQQFDGSLLSVSMNGLLMLGGILVTAFFGLLADTLFRRNFDERRLKNIALFGMTILLCGAAMIALRLTLGGAISL